MGLVKAIRLAIKGWHLQRFTAQMLAVDAFRATALEGYARVEGLLERALSARARLRPRIERQVIRTIRRLRRRYRRLRPEFRQGLLPDRRATESALRELVREVPSHELVKHWIPRFETTFSNDTWRRAIETEGYEPFGGSVPVTESSIVSLAAEAVVRASEVPRLVCIRLEGGRREVRARLIELGIALTGDAARAEVASGRRAFVGRGDSLVRCTVRWLGPELNRWCE